MGRRLGWLGLWLVLGGASASAQPQFFRVELENTGPAYAFSGSGAFDTPEGAAAPAAIGPGEAYVLSFDAAPGSRLSLATMFVQSNDLFYAPGPEGIALWDEAGMPVSGDVTDQLRLWDAGTEVNEAPGEGAAQAPRQAGPDTGADEGGVVQPVNDGFAYPAVADVIRVTLTPMGGTTFMARIENVSVEGTLTTASGTPLAVPLAPGVWVVHTADAPLFTDGAADAGLGLEALAEDGDPSGLAAALAADTGVTPILSPGLWAVHNAPAPLFTDGAADAGLGLEALAEDGDPSGLVAALAPMTGVSGGAFAVPEGAGAPGPLLPGGRYAFTIAAMPGSRLSLATMFVQSNDLFYAPDPEGLALWDDAGMPVSGDVTAQLRLWDAGTEVNERPGFGLNQAPRQAGPDTGADEGGVVQPVNDGFTYPAAADVARLTITPLETTPFTVRVENVSVEGTLTTASGTPLAVPLAPGVWVVHTADAPLFTDGAADAGLGLEALAEDGDPSGLGAFLAGKPGLVSGAFDTPEGAAAPAAIGPGEAYVFSFDAAPGSRLSLATMFVQSNDLFYAPGSEGIALWDEAGMPVSGDVTAQLRLWDAGTEVNEAPGEGAAQAPRQAGPDTGADEGGVVQPVNDGFAYPAVADVIRVTVNATATGVEEGPVLTETPAGFRLGQNYPNPFNPQTVIPYALDRPGHARLRVYNLLGQEVARLLDGLVPAGVYQATWDGRDTRGAPVATGVYLYRLEVGGASQTRRLVVLR